MSPPSYMSEVETMLQTLSTKISPEALSQLRERTAAWGTVTAPLKQAAATLSSEALRRPGADSAPLPKKYFSVAPYTL